MHMCFPMYCPICILPVLMGRYEVYTPKEERKGERGQQLACSLKSFFRICGNSGLLPVCKVQSTFGL